MPTHDSPLTQIATWVAQRPQVLLCEVQSDGATLYDVRAAKHLTLTRHAVEHLAEKKDRQTGASYLVLQLATGAQLVLCDQGFAFAPSFVNTGPLPIPTEVLCMRDYHTILAQVHTADPARRGEAVQLVMVLIALLDGARAVGLDVSREERTVDEALRRLEGAGP